MSPAIRACARLASESIEAARTAAAEITAHVRRWGITAIEIPTLSPSDPIEVVAAVAAVLAASTLSTQRSASRPVLTALEP